MVIETEIHILWFFGRIQFAQTATFLLSNITYKRPNNQLVEYMSGSCIERCIPKMYDKLLASLAKCKGLRQL